ncbi:hypothetical protein [Noviherbaspirillum malthae]|uniref:hypothetical protein n=1 Tax=Noviherbaspirillum malthae TaxID=1260987 RepID=UPI00188EC8A1|nr:hypothetical protein [Noviherbaspirillum malthae]
MDAKDISSLVPGKVEEQVDVMTAQFLSLLDKADVVTIDDGPYLHSWGDSEPTGATDNEIARFSWTDGGTPYTVVLNEGGIREGRFVDDGKFVCEDHEGARTVIRFFKLEKLSVERA